MDARKVHPNNIAYALLLRCSWKAHHCSSHFGYKLVAVLLLKVTTETNQHDAKCCYVTKHDRCCAHASSISSYWSSNLWLQLTWMVCEVFFFNPVNRLYYLVVIGKWISCKYVLSLASFKFRTEPPIFTLAIYFSSKSRIVI